MSRQLQSTDRLRRPRKGVLHRLHARMNRLPAHLTSEDDWRQNQPGVRLSRVFGVVLGIHVVAIGGLMAYEMFRHRESAPAGATAALRPAVRETRPATGVPVVAARSTDSFADDPKHDGKLKHVVAPGERLSGIASLYEVDEKQLYDLNRLGEGRAFQSGMKLVIPNRRLQAAAPAAAGDRPPADPSSLLSGTAAAPKAASSGLGAMVAVSPEVYDPNLPVRRAELVDDAPVARSGPAAKKPAPPAAKKREVAAAAPAAAVKTKPKGRVYVVKEGDTAYRIAKVHGVNVDQLVKTNGIKPSALRPGTTLTIPAKP